MAKSRKVIGILSSAPADSRKLRDLMASVEVIIYDAKLIHAKIHSAIHNREFLVAERMAVKVGGVKKRVAVARTAVAAIGLGAEVIPSLSVCEGEVRRIALRVDRKKKEVWFTKLSYDKGWGGIAPYVDLLKKVYEFKIYIKSDKREHGKRVRQAAAAGASVTEAVPSLAECLWRVREIATRIDGEKREVWFSESEYVKGWRSLAPFVNALKRVYGYKQYIIPYGQ